MSQYVETPTRSDVAAGAIGQYLRVKTTGALVLAGASDVSIGTMEKDCLAAGPCTVRLASAQGTRKMVAAGSFAADAVLYAAANGTVDDSGTVIEGRAMEASTGVGDIVEVMPLGANTLDAGTVTETGTQTLTNKTLTAPTLTAPVINLPIIVDDLEAHTAGDTLTIAESGSTHTNTGASGAITIVLPDATVGQWFVFHVGAAQELRIDPNTTQTISLPSTGVQGDAGKYLTANAVGEWVKLKCVIAGTWTAEGYAGTWTAEP